MIITISDMWKNQQKMLDNDNQIKLSSLIVILAAKYNMATLEERTRFKLRCEVLMLEIKDRNHKGKQGAYTADDHARHSFLKRTALPGLRWGKVPVPGEHDQRTLPDARRRVRSLSLLSLPRALCARSDQTVETVDWTKSWPPSP